MEVQTLLKMEKFFNERNNFSTKWSFKKIFFGVHIPKRKLSHAVSSYARMSVGEDPLFLYEDASFGSGRKGFLVTSKQLYYLFTTNAGREVTEYLPLKEIRSFELIGQKSFYQVYMNQRYVGNMTLERYEALITEGFFKLIIAELAEKPNVEDIAKSLQEPSMVQEPPLAEEPERMVMEAEITVEAKSDHQVAEPAQPLQQQEQDQQDQVEVHKLELELDQNEEVAVASEESYPEAEAQLEQEEDIHSAASTTTTAPSASFTQVPPVTGMNMNPGVGSSANKNPNAGSTAHVIPMRKPVAQDQEDWSDNSYVSITKRIRRSGRLSINGGTFKRLSWFILVNAAIILSLTIISGGLLLFYAPFLILFSATFPFLFLLLSRWMAKRSHGIVPIEPHRYQNEEEKNLYEMVESLAHKAGLPHCPEVGIYHSDEINAFATGASKKKSLVAFSTGLLDNMDEQSVTAVAAHEVAHIANGDMVTLTLVQSVVNTIISIITIPLSIFNWFIHFFSEHAGTLTAWLVTLCKYIITIFLVFLGSLVVKLFSRKREFAADKLAAELFSRDAMIGALEALRGDTPVIERHQQEYAAFKINGPRRWTDIFSTHPNIERRIYALKKLN